MRLFLRIMLCLFLVTGAAQAKDKIEKNDSPKPKPWEKLVTTKNNRGDVQVVERTILPQQSKTGAKPPKEVLENDAKNQAVPSPLGVEVLLPVPAYGWRHGSAPTAVGMVLGYYDMLGYSDLFPGDASTQTEDVNQGIASQRPDNPGHYEDYSMPIEEAGPYFGLIPDKSELGGAHPSDSLADFMATSWSAFGNPYGWTWNSYVGFGFADYVNYKNPSYNPRWNSFYAVDGSFTWDMFTWFIDNGYPMVFMVDPAGYGSPSHFVTVVGYRDTPTRQYACLDTWYPYADIRWCDFLPVGGQPWGVYQAWVFSLGDSPQIATDPAQMMTVLREGDTMPVTKTLNIYNTGAESLTWDLEWKGDIFYLATDSTQPGGPAYDWYDISGSGTSVSLGDDVYAQVPLPFAFPFYGQDKTYVYISSNGFLTFDSCGASRYSNGAFPNINCPNDVIAPFWDDLYPPGNDGTGTVHYGTDSYGRFVVQYTNVSGCCPNGDDLTFQVILDPNGNILFQYNTMIGGLTDSTIGIENSTGTQGLTLASNQPYVQDGMAVLISPNTGIPPWLSFSATSGVVGPGGAAAVGVTINPSYLGAGVYSGDILLHTNDPVIPVVRTPFDLVFVQDLILFYRDDAIGDDIFDDAFANLGILPVFTSDPYLFAALLDNDWDLVVALQQSWYYNPIFGGPLANFVAGGGRAILADWSSLMTGDQTLANVFEGSYTGYYNETTITPDGHKIWQGLPGTVNLYSPGWGIFSMGLAPIGGGLASGSFSPGNAAVIVGNNGRTLLNGFLSDTFATQAEGVLLAQNEIRYLLPAQRDFNNDGNTDILWHNGSTGQPYIWMMDGDGWMAGIAAPPAAGTAWKPVLTEDYNSDGNEDMVWHNTSTGQISIWMMDGNGGRLTTTSPGSSSTAWYPILTGDYNSDGNADIVWHNTANGQLAIWMMNGAGGRISVILTGNNGLNWKPVLTEDYNSDGMKDIVWHNTSTGQLIIWIMNGAGGKSSVASPGSAAVTWKPLLTADYNDDGNADIVWHNADTGAVTIWMMNGAGGRASSRSVGSESTVWTPGFAADFNSDRDADIFWYNSTAGATRYWMMDGTGGIDYTLDGDVTDPLWTLIK